MNDLNTIDVVSPSLREQSITQKRDLTLPPDLALGAISELEQAGWSISHVHAVHISSFNTRSGRVGHKFRYQGWVSTYWQVTESWSTYCARSCKQMSEVITKWQRSEPDGLVMINASSPHGFLEQTEHILKTYFGEGKYCTVTAKNKCIPLVCANVRVGGKSYLSGQKVYIYDGYWGMNERVHVVHRIPSTKKWIRGVYAIEKLCRFRPRLVYDPKIKWVLHDTAIHESVFGRFWDMPTSELPPIRYSHVMKRKH